MRYYSLYDAETELQLIETLPVPRLRPLPPPPPDGFHKWLQPTDQVTSAPGQLVLISLRPFPRLHAHLARQRALQHVAWARVGVPFALVGACGIEYGCGACR